MNRFHYVRPLPIVSAVAAALLRDDAHVRRLAQERWRAYMHEAQPAVDPMVANAAPADLRGTAYGFFNLISGAAMLVASAVAGLLWDTLGASFTFLAGAAFCVVALGIIAASRSLVR